MTVTNFNLGNLDIPVTREPQMVADGTTQRHIFKFKVTNSVKNVAISTTGEGQVSSPFSLALFRDINGNGSLDSFETAPSNRLQLSDSGSGTNEANESLNRNLAPGTYFAEAKAFAFSNINYTLRARNVTTGANPLTTPEIQIGTIAQDLLKTNSVSNKDTADNFAFTLDGKSSLNIDVRELGDKTGDVNIRVVQDLNGNGFVDKGEVVSKGISNRNGNVDTITGLSKAGDYILQVCQTSGNTQFGVNFDYSAA